MKNAKVAILTAGLFCTLLTAGYANTYRFDFVPVVGSALSGSYLDFATPSGIGSGDSLLDFNIVTPVGTFTEATSSASLTGLIWDAATASLTGTATFTMTAPPGQAASFFTFAQWGTEIVWSGGGAGDGSGIGYWNVQVLSSSVPDTADTLVLTLLGVGLLCAAGFFWSPARSPKAQAVRA